MNWLTQPLERVFLRPLRSLGGLSFDVVVSEEHEDTLTIAKHPVEQGANISDHAYRNPCKVVIRGASSESTLMLSFLRPAGLGPVQRHPLQRAAGAAKRP